MGELKAPPLGAGDPKLLLPKPVVLAPVPPKIDCPDCEGELGCPKAEEPKPVLAAPEVAPPKMFAVLVFALALLPKAEVPPNIDPPAADGLVATDPKSPPLVLPVLPPNMLEAVVAGVVALETAPNIPVGC